MKKVHQEILLKVIKLLNVALMTVPFAACWYVYYAKRIVMPFQGKGNLLTLAIFALVYIVFAKIYEGFQIQIKPISEIAYSQSLAVLVSDGILFLVTWLLTRTFPNPLADSGSCDSNSDCYWLGTDDACVVFLQISC